MSDARGRRRVIRVYRVPLRWSVVRTNQSAVAVAQPELDGLHHDIRSLRAAHSVCVDVGGV